jgi:hypothetical protein
MPDALCRKQTGRVPGEAMTRATAAIAPAEPALRRVNPGLMTKVFYAFAVLALLSLGISVAGKWFGSTIAMAGYTDDPTVREVVIGNDVVAAPSNTIRFERARRDGVAARLDLYLRWPALDGYSEAARADFNNSGDRRRILFLAFEERIMSRDMSGRYEPIYKSLIVQPGTPGPGDLTVYEFKDKSGYLNEQLVVAARPGKDPFVARCLTGPSAEESLAPCERDVQVGENLSLTYRFPAELLGEWRTLDEAVAVRTALMLKTGR